MLFYLTTDSVLTISNTVISNISLVIFEFVDSSMIADRLEISNSFL